MSQSFFFLFFITSSYTNNFLFTGTHFTRHRYHLCTTRYHHHHSFSPPPPPVFATIALFTNTCFYHLHQLVFTTPHIFTTYHHHHALSPPTTTSTCQHVSGRVPQSSKRQQCLMNDERGLEKRARCVFFSILFFSLY